jgi:hypothetical protein
MPRGVLGGHFGIVVVEEVDEVLGFGHVFGYEADGVSVNPLNGVEEGEGFGGGIVF